LLQKRISIAIPASVVSDTPHLREKTSKIGLIGRAAAIFRVNQIIIYPDDAKARQASEPRLIGTLLAYMETPQYLRKKLFKLEPALRYAGILPPLRTLHHPLNRKAKDLKIGEFREGVTLSKTAEGTLLDIGVERPALMRNAQLPNGKRITVTVAKVNGQVEVKLANREDIQEYWGYTVDVEDWTLGKILNGGDFELTIATSKYGVPFTDAAMEMTERWEKARTIIIAFGAPAKGLYEIARSEGLNLDDLAHFVVNTIPKQGTETVRTEEAIVATLAVFNTQFRF